VEGEEVLTKANKYPTPENIEKAKSELALRRIKASDAIQDFNRKAGNPHFSQEEQIRASDVKDESLYALKVARSRLANQQNHFTNEEFQAE
jgi:hypothetical protein